MRQAGFTLLEVMVAVTVFGILYVMASVSLNAALDNRERALETMERMAELQVAMSLVGREFEQISNRPINNFIEESGALVGGFGIDANIEFTRTGRILEDGVSLQRVAYGIKDEKLIRFHWNMLDRAQSADPKELVLVKGVREFTVEFFDGENWQNSWSSTKTVEDEHHQQKVVSELPRAVRFTLDTKDWGKISRIFRVVDNDES